MTTKTKLVKRQSSVLLPERDIDKSPVLECVGLGVTFGGLKAVEDFDLTIGRTEIAGLIGPNGAGKTTVFNLLTEGVSAHSGRYPAGWQGHPQHDHRTGKQGRYRPDVPEHPPVQ